MLSKKEYIKIAGILRNRILETRPDSNKHVVVLDIITDLCVYFKQDNPGFNVDTFNKAVYGE